jgi:hypothetical protein
MNRVHRFSKTPCACGRTKTRNNDLVYLMKGSVGIVVDHHTCLECVSSRSTLSSRQLIQYRVSISLRISHVFLEIREMTLESSNRGPSLPCESNVNVILETLSFVSVELVEWRSGQVVFLPLSRPESTGSTLLNAKFFMP